MTWAIDSLPPPSRWLWLALFSAIVALAAYLRFYHLGLPSFWHDEVFSLDIIDRPFGELWGLRKDVHPPLYYMMLQVWFGWVGYDEAGLRLSSVLFSLATLPAIYMLGRRVAGPWLGLAALLCFAVSPFAIEYAQELRAYALLGCIGAWTLYGFGRLIAAPERAALPLLRSDRLGWVLVGGGSLLALYTHNLGLLLPFTTSVVAVALWWPRPERWALARNWAIVHGIVLLLWAPWLPELVGQVRHTTGYSWIPAPSLLAILQTELSLGFGLGRFSQPLTWVTVGGLLGLAVLGARALPRPPRWPAVLLAVFLVPAVGSLAITFLFSPVYIPRTLIWTGYPVMILVGAGIVLLLARPRGWRRAASVSLLVLLAAGNGYQLWNDQRGGKNKDDWRDVAVAVAALTSPDDLVIVPGLGGDPLAYYLARLSEKSGEAAPLVLDLGAGPTKIGKLLWHAPEADRYLRVEVPWRGETAGLDSLVAVRFPCHRLVGSSKRSGMILWMYQRDPACTVKVPGLR